MRDPVVSSVYRMPFESQNVQLFVKGILCLYEIERKVILHNLKDCELQREIFLQSSLLR